MDQNKNKKEEEEKKNSGESSSSSSSGPPAGGTPLIAIPKIEHQFVIRGNIHKFHLSPTLIAIDLIRALLYEPDNTILDPILVYRGTILRSSDNLSKLDHRFNIEVRDRSEEPPSKGSYFSSSTSSVSLARASRQSSSIHIPPFSFSSSSSSAPTTEDVKRAPESEGEDERLEIQPTDLEVEAADVELDVLVLTNQRNVGQDVLHLRRTAILPEPSDADEDVE